jgi:acetyl-CoA acetyltransferase
MSIIDKFESRAVLSGVGRSAVGRQLGRSATDLSIEAVTAALDDAGLTLGDIDGVATYPGRLEASAGFSEVGAPELIDALRLEPVWWSGARESPGQLGSIITACLAVSAGLCRHVITFRTVTESTGQRGQGRRAAFAKVLEGSLESSDYRQWLVPFGAFSGVNWVAVMAQYHFHHYGTTREQLASIALNGRANAARTPHAALRTPMTLEDYLGARMISTPLCLFDCDLPIDGSTAVIVSAASHSGALRKAPVRIEAVGTALAGRYSFDQRLEFGNMAAAGSAMWRRTDLKPLDVDVAGIYDGFSILALLWLEALGFCGKGESGAFVEGGQRIAIDGELPMNTDGGQLSGGRLHGYGFIYEACRQLWREADERQVAGAEVAIVSNGITPFGGCMLLTI